MDIQLKSIVGSVSSEANDANEVWLDWRTNVPCGVSVRRGAEQFFQTSDTGAGQRYGRDVWFFTCRYKSVEGIDSTMRIRHAGLDFDIRTIRPDDQYRREVVIEAETLDAVMGGPTLRLAIPEPIKQGWVGEEYSSFTVVASGGTSPYQFTSDSAGLPPGLLLDAYTGIVSGMPTTAGTWPVSVMVSDAAGHSFTLPDFNIVINPST
jgi:hypothetical protein